MIAAGAEPPQFAADAKLTVTRGTMMTRQHEKRDCWRVEFPLALPAKRHGRVTDYAVTVKDGPGGKVCVKRLLSQPLMTLAERRLDRNEHLVCLIAAEGLKDVSAPVFSVTPLNATGKAGKALAATPGRT